MKPLHLLIPVLFTTPAITPLVAAVAEGARDSYPSELLVSSLPGPAAVSVQLTESRTIEELSSQVGIDETLLAKLNNVDEDHQFRPGDLLSLPSREAGLSFRGTTAAPAAPSMAPQRSSTISSSLGLGVIRLGDTMKSIAQRYGLTLAQLLQFNPGLETAQLLVGSQVNLVQSAPGHRQQTVLAMNPVGSGGVSWPELPSFGPQQRRFENIAPSGSYMWPTKGTFTSAYGWRWGRMHKGIDVANNVGTPIVAAQQGTVSFAGWDDGGYGYLVKISHADGSVTVYGHNSRVLVSEGQQVQQGQTISLMGSTGRSTGPHLHFEIRPQGQGAMNPLNFLPPRA